MLPIKDIKNNKKQNKGYQLLKVLRAYEKNNAYYIKFNIHVDGFEVWHTQDCRKKDAQCIQLNSACICQCLSGYSKVKGICSISKFD